MSSAPDEYSTITRPGTSELRVKGSRFFGFAQAVENEKEADQLRTALRRKYYDATHQPFAYRLATGQERSSDDGEPHGTSGRSILAEIQGADLYNAQIVVVRYFGGTKLGKGGLARAFSECARLALREAGRRRVQNVNYLRLVLPPEDVNSLKAITSQFGAKISSISYEDKAKVKLAVSPSRSAACREVLHDRFGPAIFKIGA